MGIRQVARLIGCSAWSVRQTLLPRGLPHWRSGPSGKLIFYHDQVVRWLLDQQERRKVPNGLSIQTRQRLVGLRNE